VSNEWRKATYNTIDSAVLIKDMLRVWVNVIPNLLHHIHCIEAGGPRASIGPNLHDVRRDECRSPLVVVERLEILHLEALRFALRASAAGRRDRFNVAIDCDR
jgi:hypothetical protein